MKILFLIFAFICSTKAVAEELGYRNVDGDGKYPWTYQIADRGAAGKCSDRNDKGIPIKNGGLCFSPISSTFDLPVKSDQEMWMKTKRTVGQYSREFEYRAEFAFDSYKRAFPKAKPVVIVRPGYVCVAFTEGREEGSPTSETYCGLLEPDSSTNPVYNAAQKIKESMQRRLTDYQRRKAADTEDGSSGRSVDSENTTK